MPCPVLSCCSHPPNPPQNPTRDGMDGWEVSPALAPLECGISDTARVQLHMETASTANYPPHSSPAKAFQHQATLKTQSDASAVAANLPKICTGNCLHRGRNKVWIFEYANPICRHEHVMGVSHSANAGCIQTRWAQPGLGTQGATEGEEQRMRRMGAVRGCCAPAWVQN